MTSQVGFLSFNSQEPRDGGDDDDVDCSAVLIRQNSSSLSAGSSNIYTSPVWYYGWRIGGTKAALYHHVVFSLGKLLSI